jgi:hypothetical protein
MILKNVELHWSKLAPKFPNKTFNEDGVWETQIRTRDKKQAEEWKKANLKVTPDEDQDGVFYRTMLKKACKKKDGTENVPVKVVNGSLEELDPMTIGNGSVANVRLFQYEYEVGQGKAKKTGIASMLMAVQITKLEEYIPKPREDEFEMTETIINKAGSKQPVIDDEDTDF